MKILRQSGEEIRQLPSSLVKLAGGLMAAIGLPAVVFVGTRAAEPSLSDLGPWALIGVAGVAIFVGASSVEARWRTGSLEAAVTPGDRARMSVLAWALLVALAVSFGLVAFLLGR